MCRDFVPRHPVAVVRFAVVLNGLGAVLGILGTFSIRFPPEGWPEKPWILSGLATGYLGRLERSDIISI